MNHFLSNFYFEDLKDMENFEGKWFAEFYAPLTF
jgi:hypothetical protein